MTASMRCTIKSAPSSHAAATMRYCPFPVAIEAAIKRGHLSFSTSHFQARSNHQLDEAGRMP